MYATVITQVVIYGQLLGGCCPIDLWDPPQTCGFHVQPRRSRASILHAALRLPSMTVSPGVHVRHLHPGFTMNRFAPRAKKEAVVQPSSPSSFPCYNSGMVEVHTQQPKD